MARYKYLSALFVLGVFAAALAGCGGGGGGSDVTVTPSPLNLNAASQVCANCHLSTDPTVVQQYALSLHNTETAATCAQCHKPVKHPGTRNNFVGFDGILNPDAAGVCIECHGSGSLPHFNPAIVNTAGSFDGTASAQYVDAALTSPNGNIFPGTLPPQFPTGVAGLLGCRACHNPHDTSSVIGIFRQYSEQSGHGDVTGQAWIHYRWKGADRASCQRCHTTSGVIDTLNGGTGTLTFNDADNTKQTLYCVGCHQDNTYALRTSGAVSELFSNGPIVVSATATAHLVTFSDFGTSNLCMRCHTGREDGLSIKNYVTFAPAGVSRTFANAGFINSHYLTGGSTVDRKSGYEYAGRDYTNVSFFEHNLIGTSKAPGTGDGGPCVGCHMTPVRHTFKPVTIDPATDRITAITSTVCAACHAGGFALTVDGLNAEKDEFDAALQALQVALAANAFRPMFFADVYPYFFTAPYVDGGNNTGVTNWLSAGDADATGATTGQNNMGAAFNLNLFRHDLGAFAHNRFYVKRLIYDAIDWAWDNNMNGNVEATINALPTSSVPDPYTITAAQATAAINYLLGGPGGPRP
jgi:hypothetical protein